MTTQIKTYGKCPQCGGEGLTRERRPNGNDKCVNGHTYPSASALAQPNEPVITIGDYMPLKLADMLRELPFGTKLYTSPPNTSALEAKVKELENEVADLNRISDIRKRKAAEKTERIAELEIRNTDLVAGVKNWQEIASKSDARNAKLEVSLDESRKNYIKACKGRMDFRNSFREGKAKIADLTAKLEKMRDALNEVDANYDVKWVRKTLEECK